MDKKREMVFNLNNFLLAFSELLNSKKSAYISLNLAIKLNYDEKTLADITSLALAYDLGLNSLKNFAFIDKNIIKDKKAVEIIEFSRAIISDYGFLKNSIYDRKNSLEFVKNSNFSVELKDIYIELSNSLKFFLDLENSDEIINFIYTNLNDFTTVLDFEDIFKMTKELHFFENKNSKLLKYAEIMVDFFEFEHKDKEVFKIAASLQNIGKLTISKEIINKKMELTFEEKEIIKSYTYHTRRALKQIMQFDEIVKLCEKVQERLDGSGYFQGLKAKDLSFKDRLLSSLVIYSALKEDRVYRVTLSHEKAIEIMKTDAKNGKIDESLVEIFDKVFIDQ